MDLSKLDKYEPVFELARQTGWGKKTVQGRDYDYDRVADEINQSFDPDTVSFLRNQFSELKSLMNHIISGKEHLYGYFDGLGNDGYDDVLSEAIARGRDSVESVLLGDAIVISNLTNNYKESFAYVFHTNDAVSKKSDNELKEEAVEKAKKSIHALKVHFDDILDNEKIESIKKFFVGENGLLSDPFDVKNVESIKLLVASFEYGRGSNLLDKSLHQFMLLDKRIMGNDLEHSLIDIVNRAEEKSKKNKVESRFDPEKIKEVINEVSNQPLKTKPKRKLR